MYIIYIHTSSRQDQPQELEVDGMTNATSTAFPIQHYTIQYATRYYILYGIYNIYHTSRVHIILYNNVIGITCVINFFGTVALARVYNKYF